MADHAPDCVCHVCQPYTEWLGDKGDRPDIDRLADTVREGIVECPSRKIHAPSYVCPACAAVDATRAALDELVALVRDARGFEEAEADANERAEAAEARVAELGNELAQERSKPGGSFDQWARLQQTEARVAELEAALDRIASQAEWSIDPENHIAASWVAARARAALAGDEGGTRQVKADPAVFGESNRLLAGDGGGA